MADTFERANFVYYCETDEKSIWFDERKNIDAIIIKKEDSINYEGPLINCPMSYEPITITRGNLQIIIVHARCCTFYIRASDNGYDLSFNNLIERVDRYGPELRPSIPTKSARNIATI